MIAHGTSQSGGPLKARATSHLQHLAVDLWGRFSMDMKGVCVCVIDGGKYIVKTLSVWVGGSADRG